jgi:4-oxalocrotonate tautomerase
LQEAPSGHAPTLPAGGGRARRSVVQLDRLAAREFPRGCLARRTARCDNPSHVSKNDPNALRREAMPNITIQWYAGRTDQQKREITAAITDAMVKIGKTTADQVHIVFQDVEKANWGVNGKLASD